MAALVRFLIYCDMGPTLLEEWEECNRMQHADRKTPFSPLPLTGDEHDLTKAEVLVRRGVDGMYIDACETEDTLERTYIDAFPNGVEWDYGLLDPKIATLKRLCAELKDDLRWTTTRSEQDTIEERIRQIEISIAAVFNPEIAALQNLCASSEHRLKYLRSNLKLPAWQNNQVVEEIREIRLQISEAMQALAPLRGNDKVRLIIRQKSEDDEKTLVDDVEEQQLQTNLQPVESPGWWHHFCDPEQEKITEKQAEWLFAILFVTFVSFAIVINGLWPFLLSSLLCCTACFVVLWTRTDLFAPQNYKWRAIDTTELQKINPRVCMEYVRWLCDGTIWAWTSLQKARRSGLEILLRSDRE